MIATTQSIISNDPPPRGGSWEDILGRVLGGINGAANPGQVTVGGSTPVVYAPTGTGAATDYTPLLLIALVVVAIVVLSK